MRSLPPQASADTAEYAIKYAGKNDQQDGNVAVVESVQQLSQRYQDHTTKDGTRPAAGGGGSAAERGKWALAHACNAAHGSMTLPMTLAVSLASGTPQALESHQYRVHDLRLFQKLLMPSAPDLRDVPITVTPELVLPRPPAGAAAGPQPMDLDTDSSDADGSDADSSDGEGDLAEVASAEATTDGSSGEEEETGEEEHDWWNEGRPLTDAAGDDDPEQGAGGGDGAAPARPAPLPMVDARTDYLHRGPALASLSAVLLSMWAYKVRLLAEEVRALDAAEEQRLPPPPVSGMRLGPGHPQYRTHRWALRQHPFLVQPISEFPLRPVDDAPAAVREAFAAWALGNFGVYQTDGSGGPSLKGPLWPQYLALVDPANASDAARIAQEFLRNAQSRAQTRLRGDERRAQLAAEQPEPGSAAEALQRLMPELSTLGTHAADSEDLDDDDPDAAHAAADTELAMRLLAGDTSAADVPLADAARSSACAAFSAQPCRADHYAAEAVRMFPPLNLAPTSGDAGDAVPLDAQQAQQAAAAPGGAPTVQFAVSQDLLDGVRQQQAARQAVVLNPPVGVDPARVDGAGTPQLTFTRHANGEAAAVLTTIGPDGSRHSALCPAGKGPAFVLCAWADRPSPEDAADLFSLSPDQREPFLLLAYTLLAEVQGKRCAPVNAILTGDAGCGKSRVVIAFLWFAFQHRASKLIAVAAYMWKAAMNVTTPSSTAVSTTTLFALGNATSFRGNKRGDGLSQASFAAAAEHLHGRRFIIIDEYGVLGLLHFALCCITAQSVSAVHHGPTTAPMGHFHSLLAGHVAQHVGPSAAPMYASAERPTPAQVEAQQGSRQAKRDALMARGADLLRQYDKVFYLTTQHRRNESTAAGPGAQLQRVAHLWDGLGRSTRTQVHDAVCALNDKAAEDLDPTQRVRVVVLRHLVQLYLNRRLAEREAQRLQQPIYVWRCVDTLKDGSAVPPSLAEALENASYDRTGKVPTYGVFFAGMLFCFTDSKAPALYRITNNDGEMVSLLPHPLEPGPLPTAPGTVHALRYVPQGIVVRPDGPPLGRIVRIEEDAGLCVPDGCMVMFPGTATFRFPEPGGDGRLITVHRWGIPLGDGYAVTDYAAQGASFGLAKWLIHLNPPNGRGGTMARASVFVMLTRYGGWDTLALLCRLWRTGDEVARKRVINILVEKARRDNHLAAELERLQDHARTTRASFQQLLDAAVKEAAGWKTAQGNR